MEDITWSFCHQGDWFTYFMAWMLLYPYVVWGGFFIAGMIFASPVLTFVSSISSIGTYLLCWGLQELLKVPRHEDNHCDATYALPDRRFVIGVVNVLTVILIVLTTRTNVRSMVIIKFTAATLLYFVAVNTNNYLTPIQFLYSLSLSLSLASMWSATYTLMVRPFLHVYGFKDISLLGIERSESSRSEKRIVMI